MEFQKYEITNYLLLCNWSLLLVLIGNSGNVIPQLDVKPICCDCDDDDSVKEDFEELLGFNFIFLYFDESSTLEHSNAVFSCLNEVWVGLAVELFGETWILNGLNVLSMSKSSSFSFIDSAIHNSIYIYW